MCVRVAIALSIVVVRVVGRGCVLLGESEIGYHGSIPKEQKWILRTTLMACVPDLSQFSSM